MIWIACSISFVLGGTVGVLFMSFLQINRTGKEFDSVQHQNTLYQSSKDSLTPSQKDSEKCDR